MKDNSIEIDHIEIDRDDDLYSICFWNKGIFVHLVEEEWKALMAAITDKIKNE